MRLLIVLILLIVFQNSLVYGKGWNVWGDISSAFKEVGRTVQKETNRWWRDIEKTFNIPPSISCPSSSTFTASYFKDYCTIKLGKPGVTDDKSGYTVSQVRGPSSGSKFSEGTHTITLKVTDSDRKTDYCSYTITIKVTKCRGLDTPAHGSKRCDNDENIYGTDCYFSCDSGFELDGYEKSSCEENGYYSHSEPTCSRVSCSKLSTPSNGDKRCDSYRDVYGTECTFSCDPGFRLDGYSHSTCDSDGEYSHPTPRCNRVSCPELETPAHAIRFSCTNRWYFESVCSLECQSGYSAMSGDITTCQSNQQWLITELQCEDTEKPSFTNCPNATIKSYDQRVTWPTLQVTDNSGSASISLSWGQISGSWFSVGLHVIRYNAQDTSGNTADPCVFTVHVQALYCPNPLDTFTNDSDLEFTGCNTKLTKFVENTTCQTRCKSGTQVQGAIYVRCEKNASLTATVNWVSKYAEEPHCPKRTCPPLRTPKNGAIVCDTFLSETLCQIHCNSWYDVTKNSINTYICGQNSNSWAPSNVTEDCREVEDGEVYSLPSEFYYFSDICDEEETKNEIKEHFIKALKESNVFSHVCHDSECKADNVVVTCSKNTDIPSEGMESLLWSEYSIQKKKASDNISPADSSILNAPNQGRLVQSTRAPESLHDDTFKGSKVVKEENVSSRDDLNDVSSGDVFSGASLSGHTSNSGRVEIIRDILVTVGFSLVVPTNQTSSNDVQELLTSVVHGMFVQLQNVSEEFDKLNYRIFNLTRQCPYGFAHAKKNHHKCVICEAGTYHNTSNNLCMPCPSNTYQPEDGKTSCLHCPPRTATRGDRTKTLTECIVNNPPHITCPPGGTFEAKNIHRYANIFWPEPQASDDQEGYRVSQVGGQAMGSKFYEGYHAITYRVTDAGGLTDYCTCTFTVRVIRCEKLDRPDNGRKTCNEQDIYGTQCFFTCNSGFQLDGYARSTCQLDGNYSHPTPTCSRIKCPVLKLNEEAEPYDCSDGNYYGSACLLQCMEGFRGKFGAFTHCQSNQTWSKIELRWLVRQDLGFNERLNTVINLEDEQSYVKIGISECKNALP